MADYVVHYNATSGQVLGMWARTTSDNIATCAADGYLDVDGVKVVDGIDAGYGADVEAVVLTDPTDVVEGALMSILEVDSPTSPVDVNLRTDGDRDRNWDFAVV